MSIFDLTGKTALVTGGAKGIGRETALELARLGANLVVTDIDAGGAEDTATAIRDQRGTAFSLTHDVTSSEQWQMVIAAVSSRSGRLDVLINNAGVILNRPFVQTSFQDYQRVMRINVDSVFLGCQTALPLLTHSAKTTRGSSIVNLSSIYGLVAGPMHAAYCASKGAVRLLSKALAVEFARMGTGIRVNSVHPGAINTDLGRSGVSDAVGMKLIESMEMGVEMVKRQFPMGRWGEVDDISSVIAFLASDASKFITGAELTVDGGFTLL